MLHEKILLQSTGNARITLTTYCMDMLESDDPGLKRPSIVVCGGGGYQYVSDREKEPVALRFALMGFNTFTVDYRVAPNRFPANVQDVAAAVAYVRSNADRFHSDPDRIAVLGFSAGGHVAGSLGVMWPNAELWAPLSLTPEDVKPNAMVLCYPVISGSPCAHRGSFVNLTGTEDVRVHEAYSLEKLVTAKTCPAFLWATWDDDAVPCENTLLMASALKACHVPAEVHIYPHGAHGLSLGDETTAGTNPRMLEKDVTGWPELAGAFLKRL